MKFVYDVVLLSRYLEKDLSREEIDEAVAHLEECAVCRKELERLQTAMEIMKSVREVAAPRNYAEAVKMKMHKGGTRGQSLRN
jgi:predicted anti-sigma-YlaC factor YlaD